MSASSFVLDSVAAGYPDRPDVVRGIDLEVHPGEAVALIGPSGAGKTTLLRVMARLASPCSGSVRLGELDLHEPRDARALAGRIGLVPQQHALPPSLKVATAVATGEAAEWSPMVTLRCALAGPPRHDEERIDRLLGLVGLAGRGAERLSGLSVGERQRVAVARTLLQDPSLLLADEPVASVDPSTSRTVLRLLTARAAEGAIVLCSVHDVDKAREHFSRIVALRAGEIVFDGPAMRLTDDITDFVYDGEAVS